jgi:1,4-alpha-glucan branching enzyme
MTDKTPRKRAATKKLAAKPPRPLAVTAEPTPRTELPPTPIDQIDRLVAGTHHDPHSLLGAHPLNGAVVVRALRRGAASVTVVVGDNNYPAEHEHQGVWRATLPIEQVPDYRLVVDFGDGFEHRQDDAYRYLPTLGEMDLHLISEGRHEDLWQVLGSHVRTYDSVSGPVTGTSFAVWAPSAQGVRLSADFNGWGSVSHPMRVLGSSGVWELFVPEAGDGTVYKYDVLGADGVWPVSYTHSPSPRD